LVVDIKSTLVVGSWLLVGKSTLDSMEGLLTCYLTAVKSLPAKWVVPKAHCKALVWLLGIKNSSIFGFTHIYLCLFVFVLAKAGLAVSVGAPFLAFLLAKAGGYWLVGCVANSF
jgi:hypothetical protein